jgi:hypothetical protein
VLHEGFHAYPLRRLGITTGLEAIAKVPSTGSIRSSSVLCPQPWIDESGTTCTHWPRHLARARGALPNGRMGEARSAGPPSPATSRASPLRLLEIRGAVIEMSEAGASLKKALRSPKPAAQDRVIGIAESGGIHLPPASLEGSILDPRVMW